MLQEKKNYQSLGGILTMKDLRKKHFYVQAIGESINHLRLHCELARDLGVEIFRTLD